MLLLWLNYRLENQDGSKMMALKLKPGAPPRIFFALTMLLLAASAWADKAKVEVSCGCKRDSYAVYGAGQDRCETYLKEYEANPDSDDVDTAFGQTLGWIAGYASATNRNLKKRDLYNMGLDYMTHLLSRWCRKHPDKMLSEAMDSLSDSKSGTPGFFPLD